MNRKIKSYEISNEEEDNIEKLIKYYQIIMTREWKLKIYQMKNYRLKDCQ